MNPDENNQPPNDDEAARASGDADIPAAPAKSVGPQGGARVSDIDACLDGLRRQVRYSLVVRGIALLVLIICALVLFSFGVDRLFRLSTGTRIVASLLYLGLAGYATWRLLIRPLTVELPSDILADVIERHFPELHDRLRSAVDFLRDPRVAQGGAGIPAGHDRLDDGSDDPTLWMKRRVTEQAAEQITSVESGRVVDSSRVVSALAGGLGSGFVLAILVFIFQAPFGIWLDRNVLFADVEWPFDTRLEVRGFENGSRGVPRGDPLDIEVVASGEVPDRVRISLIFERDTASYNMARESASPSGDSASGDTAEFSHHLGTVTDSFSFVVEGGDYRSRPYRVHVQERPFVEGISLAVRYPEYTGESVRYLQGDLGEVTAAEGSTLYILGVANKPLSGARIRTADGGKPVELACIERSTPWGEPIEGVFRGMFQPRGSGSVRIELDDEENVPPDRLFQFTVQLLPDREPIVKILPEGIGSMVTPQARIPLVVDAEDDYRVDSFELAWTLGDDADSEKTGTVKLDGPRTKEKDPAPEEHVWEIVDLAIQPEQRLVIRVRATDNDGHNAPKAGTSNELVLRVVTPERLSEDFLRREEEFRKLLERLIEEERQVRDEVFEHLQAPTLHDSARAPGADSVSWLAPGELPRTVRAEIQQLEKVEARHRRQLKQIATGIRDILLEMENNRIGEADDLARLAELIITPIEELAGQDIPAIEVKLTAVRTGSSPLRQQAGNAGGELEKEQEKVVIVTLFEQKLEKLDRVLANMFRLEGFTEIVKRLRVIISTQTESREAADAEFRRAIDTFLLPDEGEDSGDGTSGSAASGEGTGAGNNGAGNNGAGNNGAGNNGAGGNEAAGETSKPR